MGKIHGTCKYCEKTGLDPKVDYYSHVSSMCKSCFREYQKGRSATRGDENYKSPTIFVPPGMLAKDYVKMLKNGTFGIPAQMQKALMDPSTQSKGQIGNGEGKELAALPHYVNIRFDPTNNGDKYALMIADMIRSGTDEGKKIIEFWLRVLYDESVPLKYRFAVSQELANRLFGRPPQEVIHDVSVTHKEVRARLSGLSDDELADLDSPAQLGKYVTMEAVAHEIEDRAEQ